MPLYYTYTAHSNQDDSNQDGSNQDGSNLTPNIMHISVHVPVPIVLGRNANENIEIIKSSDPSWIWLHLDTVPSGHIVIQTSDINLSDISHLTTSSIISYAANLCLHNTSPKKQQKALYWKNNKQVFNIICTKISNIITDLPNMQPGEVEFISTSRRKLITLVCDFKNDI